MVTLSYATAQLLKVAALCWLPIPIGLVSIPKKYSPINRKLFWFSREILVASLLHSLIATCLLRWVAQLQERDDKRRIPLHRLVCRCHGMRDCTGTQQLSDLTCFPAIEYTNSTSTPSVRRLSLIGGNVALKARECPPGAVECLSSTTCFRRRSYPANLEGSMRYRYLE